MKHYLRFVAVVAGLSVLVLCLPVQAQTPEIAALQRRIKSLEREIARLKTGRPYLSGRLSRPGPNPTATGWRNQDNWCQLERGMSTMQVQTLLGAPTQTKRVGSTFQVDIYQGQVAGVGYVIGEVAFEDNRLSYWDHPVFNP